MRISKPLPAVALALLIATVCTGLRAEAQAPAATTFNPPDAQAVASFLRQSVEWYRHFTIEQQLATEPADLPYVSENRQVADEVVRLAFEFARADSQLLLTSASQASGAADDSASRYQRLLNSATMADQRAKQAREEIDGMKQELEAATGERRRALQSAIAETQSELELAETRRDVLRNFLAFIGGASGRSGGAGGLKSQIEELERAVPAAVAKPADNKSDGSAQAVASTLVAARPEPHGILALITDLRGLARKRAGLDESIQLTEALADKSKELRTPLSGILRQLAQRGDALSDDSGPLSLTSLADRKRQLDEVTLQFKQLSSIFMPLSKQRVLLDLYKASLVNWRGTVQAEYSAELRGLLIRIAALGLVLAGVTGLSELWRRAILRYVQETRRRHQFLLLRRIIVTFLVIVVVAFAFATELGSLATFAGLLTAGVAVALQNVILSVAGYFFLIGKHGVRVGDRVQISGVTGEVVDIGLVRLHLMELGPGGADAQPTGRVVVFSNSVVFQSSGGLFKQIPGTNFVWHEITLTLAAESDYRMVEERLLGAVQKVFAEYRDKMEHQRKRMQHELSSVSVDTLRPQSRLRLTQKGLDVVIRYPLELERATEIDDRITREVLDATEQEPQLKLVGSGPPNVQPVKEPAHAGAD